MSRRNPMNDRYTTEREGGASRRGASSMKPVRAAASSVRTETKRPTGNARQRALAEASMSKDEKKALKAKQREEENAIYTASSILCNKDPKYKKLRKYWWALLIGAVVFTALSWAGLAGAVGIGGEVFSIVIIVLAYACIIGALIMDFTVVRKRRNYYRDKVKAMSKRAVDRIIEASYQERVAKEAARKAKKEARKAGKSSSEASAAADEAYAKAMALATGKIELPEDDELDAKAAKKVKKDKPAKSGRAKAEVSEVPAQADAQDAQGAAADAAGSSGGAEGADAGKPEAELSEEEARKEAAARIAREFAASKRK